MARRDGRQLGLMLGERTRLAGVDEAGRGPLAGPVMAAAVVLDPGRPIDGLGDSKRIRESEREALEPVIRARALAWAVAWADPAEIDALNILQATHLAMRRAVQGLAVVPTYVQVDGDRVPRLSVPAEAVIGGDGTVAEIGAASILAKVWRDRLMCAMEARHPGYGFAGHKGYPTEAHMAALERMGPCRIHRRSFAPVRRAREGAA